VGYAEDHGPESGWQLAPGTRMDHFRVMRPLGRGGMAEVYLARDTQLGRKVALKLVRPRALGSEDAVQRFLFEARATARFNHPNIVSIYFVGQIDGRPYVALEYLEGQTLRQRTNQEQLGVQEVLRVGLAVARALEAAHAETIAHRDLKPENIMLGKDGRLRVLDFGLARSVSEADGGSWAREQAALGDTLTPEAADQDLAALHATFASKGKGVRGTPAYMAPEQWREESVGAAADIWALGVILHELLTGRRPYQEQSVFKLAMRVCSAEPVPPLQRAPDQLAALVGRCLHKDASGRPRASELVQDLREMQAGRQLVSGESPFRGLLPFDERHSRLFFGREAEVEAFVERLRRVPLMPVIGPSGAGKSSFVQAGVIPRLREKGPLELITLRPGTRPFATLASRLAAASLPSSGSTRESPFGTTLDGARTPQGKATLTGTAAGQLAAQLRSAPQQLNLHLQRLAARQGSVLLFVDQLEELYTLVDDADERIAFMQGLCAAADDPDTPVRVVLTMREEFITRLAEGPGVREALSQVTLLRSPSPEALREILLRPVEAVGYRYEDRGLVQEMIAEVQGEAACLPLLQFAGHRLWERRDRQRELLLRAPHQEAGGVVGALAEHADGVLAGLTADQVELARALLLRLATPESTRRVQPRDRLLAGLDRAAGDVLGRLAEARLLTISQATDQQGEAQVELAHEALIGSWPRLQRWIEESREELRFLHEAEQAAELWDRRGRSDEEVWTGRPLQDARVALERCSGPVPEQVLRFIRAGERRAQRRSRRNRRLALAGVTLLALVAVGALVAATIITRQKREVEQSRGRTVASKAEALADSAHAALKLGRMLETRVKLRAALETADSLLARALWLQTRSRPEVWKRRAPSWGVRSAFSPDSRWLALASANGPVHLFDVRSGKLVRSLRGKAGLGSSVAFSHDGRQLAEGFFDGTILIWDLARRSFRTLKASHGSTVVSFHPDGKLLASTSHDKLVRIWDLSSGKVVRRLEGHEGVAATVDFSPDGKRLVSSSSVDNTARVWDARTGETVAVLRGHTGQVEDAVYTPDGRHIVTVSFDHTIRVWDPRTGAPTRVIRGHTDQDIGVGAHSRLLASTGRDNAVKLWDLASGARLDQLDLERWGLDVRFSPDGKYLAAVSVDGKIYLWEVAALGRRHFRGHSGTVSSVRFRPDGRVLASASLDRSIRLWDVATGAVKRVLRERLGGLRLADFSPDGSRLVSTSLDGTIRLWAAESGQYLGLLGAHQTEANGATYSPDGRLIATGGQSNVIKIWEARSGRLLHELRGHSDGVNALDFSPDGRLLASSSDDWTLRLWDPRHGTLLRVLQGHTSDTYGARFTPDGRRLVSSSWDGTVRIWQVRDGRSSIVGRCPGHARYLDLHPNGRSVAVSCGDGTLRIFGLQTGAARVLRGHFAELDDVAYSPDGALLASTGYDQTVRLWDAATGHPRWFGALLMEDRPEVYTHRGWIGLEGHAGPGRVGRWRGAVERQARLASHAPRSQLLCVQTHDEELEAWDLAHDRRLYHRPLPGLRRTLATRAGCLTLTRDGLAQLVDRTGRARALQRQATAISAENGEVLIAAGDKVHRHDADGALRATYSGGTGAVAVTRIGQALVLGYQDNHLVQVSTRPGREADQMPSIEDVPSSPAVRLLPGPRDTVIAGFANGVIGIWSLETGTRLAQRRLHGAALHLLLKRDKLYAATDLGEHLVWDLSPLTIERCELLRQVWRKVPMVWDRGQPVVRPPPGDHPCAGQ